MMKGICLRYSKNEVEAEDLLQESFIKVFENIDQFQFKGPLGAWIRKITVNVALEFCRKNKVMNTHKEEFSIVNNETMTHDNVIEKLALENLLAKIQQLPIGYRTVFNLHAIEGFNHKEIGDLLSISEGTSKSQYSRARFILKSMIEAENKNDKELINYAK
jgi:RNA polymerase sigma factor (sigma-70 family)